MSQPPDHHFRPSSLAEVERWAQTAQEFWMNIRDFLDEFRRVRNPGMLEEEPARVAGRLLDVGDVGDAYLAAVAESLALEIGAAPPPWTKQDSRRLENPWFAGGARSPRLRAVLLEESPAPFRERNLFVSENALSRA